MPDGEAKTVTDEEFVTGGAVIVDDTVAVTVIPGGGRGGP